MKRETGFLRFDKTDALDEKWTILDKGDWRYIHWLNSKNIVYYPRDLRNTIDQTIYLIANYHWPDPDYFDYEYDVDASYS